MTIGTRTVEIGNGSSYTISRDDKGHFHCLYAEGGITKEITDWCQIPREFQPAIDKAIKELSPLVLPVDGRSFSYD